ncbi:MAG: flagellar basal body P-ring formation protein FlgA [Planctomycetota bacterium]|nr:MAG: flagellar basal body P-ring formation protein FlgA [Planctomycetota bacterium]
MLRTLLVCLFVCGARLAASAAVPASSPAAIDEPRVKATLLAEAKVGGTEVTLADVARLEGDAAAVAALGAVPLGWSPSPGYSRVIEPARVLEAVRAKAPGIAVALGGAAACRVFVHEERIAPNQLADAARRELARVLAGRDCEFDLVELPREVIVPKGRAGASVAAALELAPAASGALAVPVRVLVDGQPFRTVQTTWNVRLYETAPVLSRTVRAGEALDASMLAPQRVELRSHGIGAPLAPNALFGGVAARDIAAGSAVYAVDVHRPVVIKSGDLVTLRVNKGGISAQTRAIARAAAAVGEVINVTADTGRDVSALVVAPGIVELVLAKAR